LSIHPSPGALPAKRKPLPRGIGAHLSPEQMSEHMRDVAHQRALYSAIGKQVVELVERTRQEQGLPPQVEDPATLARIADLASSGGAT
jgi:hypothetical protein